MKQLLGVLFFTGILIAGSDGPWFPLVNVACLALSGVAVAVVNRIYEEAV